ncbi:MAG: type II toxin-antitoxin system VapC family toxin [Acidimicrobiia bacterium]|nr:type II toxin-antitoxin system VapC family toxin [Acidimicrobiia bacterium]
MYEDCTLTLDRIGAEWSARFRAQARRSGQVLDLGDALIAGTARAHNLTIATRNVADFRYVAIDVFDPWDSGL